MKRILSFGGQKQVLGTAGGSTTGEDAKRVEKSGVRKFIDKLSGNA